MSFRLKTILGVALIEAVLLGVLLWSGLGFLASTAESEFTQRTQSTARAFSVAAKNSLISSDLGALQALTREMLQYPGVTYARVRDTDGRVLAEAGEAAALKRMPRPRRAVGELDDGVLDATDAVSEAGTTFGRIEVGVSAALLQQRSADARRFGFGLVALEMLLVGLFSYVLGAYLTRQLRDLTGAAGRLAAGDRGVQIPVRGRDELASTAVAFNQMSARLMASYDDLADRERDLRRVLANIVDGILTLDSDGQVLSASPSAARMFGQGVTEVQGRAWLDLFADEDRPVLVEAGHALAAQGAAASPVLLVRTRSVGDSPAWLEVQLSHIDDAGEGPHPARALAVVRDVSARVAAERELLLRGRIIESTSIGIVIADASRPELPVIDVNPAFTRITGYSREEVAGRNCRFLQGVQTDQAAVQRIRTALAERREVSELVLNYRRDGSTFWNQLQIMPSADRTGRVTHFVALQSDVTLRVCAEQELARSEAYLRQVLNASRDAIIVTDEHGTVEIFNAGAEAMFERPAAEVIGGNVSLIVPEPHGRQHDGYLSRYLQSGEPHILGQQREFEARRRDGSVMWIALRVTEMLLTGRRRYIGVVHDITERKLAELDLRRAKEVAEDAANAKSEFLANMSHEIRTPMHGVLGSMEILRDTPLNGQQQRLVETANASAAGLLGVIDEILDFSRLEAGKLRIESIEFDVRQTVEDVTAMMGLRAHAKQVELACYIAPEVPAALVGDPIRLRQVLVNLVGNAVKFTERGEVVVSVALAPAADAAFPQLRFEVRDSGIGIPQDKLARLFEPFTQADSSTSRRFGGSGLGLSIARRLVVLMHGEIGFESREGVGSTFWFTLPARAVQGGRRAAPGPGFGGRRALVVDDNATNRIILHRYLTAWGAQSSSAAAGEEALAKLQDAAAAGRPYDVVLTDLNMPMMDGYMLVQRIQADAALADTPVIVLSSSVQDEARSAGLRIDVWLDKPVRQSDLYDAMATVMKQREEHVQPVAEVRSEHRAPRFAGERILLVEDNAITREVGEQMLRGRGLAVTLATDGAQAVEAVKHGGIDLVLMDVQMPGVDGYAATREIRAWEAATHARRLPVVALTAHAQPTDRERCLAAGMDDYVVKPYSGAGLSTVIARWLAPPGSATAEPAHGVPVLDAVRVAEVRTVMGDSFDELVGRACDTLRDQMRALADACSRGAVDDALERVHRLKNTAGDVGASRLQKLGAELERSITSAGRFEPPLEAVSAVCADAVEALEALRGERWKSP